MQTAAPLPYPAYTTWVVGRLEGKQGMQFFVPQQYHVFCSGLG